MVYKTFLFVVTSALLSATWVYHIDPMIEQAPIYESTSAKVEVVVPIQGTTYYTVVIDKYFGAPLRTNKSNVWEFERGVILKTNTHDPSQNGYAFTNKEALAQVGDSYVSVHQKDRYIAHTLSSMWDNKPWEGIYVEPDESRRKDTLEKGNPVDFNKEDSGFLFPTSPTALRVTQSNDDITVYDYDFYFNYNFRYQKEDDATKEAITRVCTLGNGEVDWFYISKDGKNKLYVSGDEYVLIKMRDYTSCYYISTNSYDYAYMNMKGGL